MGGHLTHTNAGSRRPLILDSCPSFPSLSGTSSQEHAAAHPVLELVAEDALFCNPHAARSPVWLPELCLDEGKAS